LFFKQPLRCKSGTLCLLSNVFNRKERKAVAKAAKKNYGLPLRSIAFS
jgi:hypothetical protein